MPTDTDIGGGGDPHLSDVRGVGFEFKGVPGEVYKLLDAHRIGMRMTVRDMVVEGGETVQVIDRLQVFLPHPDSDKNPRDCTCIAIDPDYITITTPEWKIAAKQDRGHATHEGEVYPDPLYGDRPHLDFHVQPKMPLDDNGGTSGILYDGMVRPESEYRTGEFWSPGTLLPDQDETLPERLRSGKPPAHVVMSKKDEEKPEG